MEYKNNKLYINGKKVKEKITGLKTEDFDSILLGSEKIPKDCYLVLGDNRGNSQDSRALGFIKRKDILGKTSFTIFPFNRFGSKK